jgi:hypothetical protein
MEPNLLDDLNIELTKSIREVQKTKLFYTRAQSVQDTLPYFTIALASCALATKSALLAGLSFGSAMCQIGVTIGMKPTTRVYECEKWIHQAQELRDESISIIDKGDYTKASDLMREVIKLEERSPF